MVRSTLRASDGAIAVTCPKCKRSTIFIRGFQPHIDRCGFESHSFRCGWCSSYLGGVVDPIDDELVVYLLEQPSDVSNCQPEDNSDGAACA
jgi:hypothetical protein